MGTKFKIAFTILTVLVVGSLLGILIFGDQNTVYIDSGTQIFTTEFGTSYKGLIYNNTELVDHRYLITEERCEAGNLGMNISIYPCVSNVFDAVNITNFVDFSWHGGEAQNTSWVFVYEGEIESGEMLLGHDEEEAYFETVYTEQWVNNYLVQNVVSYQDISPPNIEACDLGTENNTQMYEVTQNNGTLTTTNYCFTTVQVVNATAFLLSGNATIEHQEELTRNVTIYDQNVNVEYMGFNLLGNNFSFYKVQDVTFQPEQTYKTKWIYTPEGEAGTGKWHIFGYNSNLELNEAIDFGQYIYVDPEWTDDLNQDLCMYWNFNDQKENVDGVYNLTAYEGTATFQNNIALIGNATNITVGNNWQVADNNCWDFVTNKNSTLSFWAYSTVAGNNQFMFTKEGVTDNWRLKQSTSVDRVALENLPNSAQTVNIGLNTWNMYTVLANATHVTLFKDGSYVGSSTYGGAGGAGIAVLGDAFNTNDWTGYMDEFGVWNRTLTPAEITQLYNGGAGLSYTEQFDSGSLEVWLIEPTNNLITLNNQINFSSNQTAEGIMNNTNATLQVWNSTSDLIIENSTALSGNGTAFLSWNGTVFADDIYAWNVLACGTNGTTICEYSVNGNFSFNVDTNAPVLILEQNLTDIFVESTNFPQNVTINYTVLDNNPDTCFVYTSDDSTNQTFTCNTLHNISFNNGGLKTVFYGANDTLGFTTIANTTVDLGVFAQSVDVNPIGEGQDATFTLELNKTGIGGETISAHLNYNSVAYPYSTLTIPNSDQVIIIRDLTIPDGIGSTTGANIAWNWSFNTSVSGNFTTSTENQTVYSVDIDDCSSFGDMILNMTLREEDTRNVINASAGSNIEIDLILSSRSNSNLTWEYSNTWTDEAEATVCVPSELLNNSEYRIDFVAEYGATDRVIEFFYLDNGTLDNTQVLDSLTNRTINFYDLVLAESTTFLFEFLDQDSIEVPDAIVHVFRQYIGEGIFEEVERGKQDDNGETHIHLVEEDVIYFFKVSLEGEVLFTSATYNAKCLSSPCAITLTASTETPQFDTENWQLFGDGGGYVFFNDGITRTVYLNFTTPDPSTINLTVAKQDYTGELTAVESQTVLSTGGTLSVAVPQSAGNVTYYAIVYKDEEFISYDFVDFSTPASAYYGTTGTVMASLLLVALILMGAAEGILLFVFIIIAFILVGALTLLELGYYALVGFICAVAILIWKLIKRGRRFEGI